jgi:glucan phosphoethanolaminetransferase (alkaline phosphatase superfamily)
LIFITPKIWQWILLFAYPPAFMAFYGMDFKRVNSSDRLTNFKEVNLTQASNNISTSYIFWFCIYFALIHSIIIVFSDQKLTSLRRFIFGTPYFFVAIAYISNCFPTRKVTKLLLWLLGFSSIWLVQYWLDYANDVWIG